MPSESHHQPEDLNADWLDDGDTDVSALDLDFAAQEAETDEKQPFHFETHFRGTMGMYGDINAVSAYLDAHEGWFVRCAQPMTAEPLGNNGYTLTIGRFGSFGYEVEPKIGVVLLPPEDRTYYMHSIPVPEYAPPGYDVDYHAWMQLSDIATQAVEWGGKELKNLDLPPTITDVEWQLNLKVMVQFPRFIYKLPQKLIQKTGDQLLAQIVRQVSPRLTYKVQKDFHERLGLPVPPKQSRLLERV